MSKYSEHYKYYLQSRAWQIKRQQVLKRDNYVCQACLNVKATEVHHKTYLHLGDEPLFDLVSVCGTCHNKLTLISKNRASIPDLEYSLERLFLTD